MAVRVPRILPYDAWYRRSKSASSPGLYFAPVSRSSVESTDSWTLFSIAEQHPPLNWAALLRFAAFNLAPRGPSGHRTVGRILPRTVEVCLNWRRVQVRGSNPGVLHTR